MFIANFMEPKLSGGQTTTRTVAQNFKAIFAACCTARWKGNGKTTTLSLFLDSLFPETEIPCMQDPWRQERILSFEGGSSRSH
jgi:hypothetical protein